MSRGERNPLDIEKYRIGTIRRFYYEVL